MYDCQKSIVEKARAFNLFADDPVPAPVELYTARGMDCSYQSNIEISGQLYLQIVNIYSFSKPSLPML